MLYGRGQFCLQDIFDGMGECTNLYVWVVHQVEDGPDQWGRGGLGAREGHVSEAVDEVFVADALVETRIRVCKEIFFGKLSGE